MPYPLKTAVVLLSVFGIGSWLFRPAIRGSPANHASGSIPGASRDILNETLGFQNIFVINLPSRTDRRDTMTLAAALTGIKLDWIDGVSGDKVPDKVLPPDSLDKNISKGNRGSWRAHMNALRTIIDQNLTTALILEDDIDWDVRLKLQLQNFSLATQSYLQSHTPHPPSPLQETTTPYGDPNTYDLLWLGHCGTSFPHPPLPPLRIPILSDPTVPSAQHLRPHPFAGPDAELIASHPPHTRVVHAVGADTACTQGYAVSRRGAERLLWMFGTRTFTRGFDLMVGDWCAGRCSGGMEGEGEEGPVCVIVQPPLFVQHYGRGGESDITAPGGGFIDRGKEMTPYVRLSVRLNMGRLVRGDGMGELVDQWPD